MRNNYNRATPGRGGSNMKVAKSDRQELLDSLSAELKKDITDDRNTSDGQVIGN